MSKFGHSTDIYPIGQMSEYVLFYGHLSYRLDVYRSDGVTPIILGHTNFSMDNVILYTLQITLIVNC